MSGPLTLTEGARTDVVQRKNTPQTCFSCCFGCKISSKSLQHLCHLLLHKEANEGGGGVQLQREGRRDTTSPLLHRGLERIGQSLHLPIGALSDGGDNKTREQNKHEMSLSQTQTSARCRTDHEELAERDVREDVVGLVFAAGDSRLLPEARELLEQRAAGSQV